MRWPGRETPPDARLDRTGPARRSAGMAHSKGRSPQARGLSARVRALVGPTKPITGIVRLKGPASRWLACRSSVPNQPRGPRSRPGPTRKADSASSVCPRASL